MDSIEVGVSWLSLQTPRRCVEHTVLQICPELWTSKRLFRILFFLKGDSFKQSPNELFLSALSNRMTLSNRRTLSNLVKYILLLKICITPNHYKTQSQKHSEHSRSLPETAALFALKHTAFSFSKLMTRRFFLGKDLRNHRSDFMDPYGFLWILK